MKILVVDEFSATRIIVTNILIDLGFVNTVEVSDGYTALKTLKSSIFDCVIAEWDMKEMNGLELLKQIRADNFLKNIPVLIISENSFEENIVSATKAGANDYVVKPFKIEDFAEKLKNILKKF